MAYQKKSERPDREDRGEFTSRRRPAIPANDKIDLNDIEVLKRYVTEYGKIIPARVTGVTAMQQRQIKKGVRRAPRARPRYGPSPLRKSAQGSQTPDKGTDRRGM